MQSYIKISIITSGVVICYLDKDVAIHES